MAEADEDPRVEMVTPEGGAFRVGSSDESSYPDDGETPREVDVDTFRISLYGVSNAHGER